MAMPARAVLYTASISKVIGTVHLLLGMMGLAVYISASLTGSGLPFVGAGLVFTFLFFASALVQRTVRPTRRRIVWGVAAADILLFSLVIWFLAELYLEAGVTVLPGPAFSLVFALIALQVLRRDYQLVLFVGSIALGAGVMMIIAGNSALANVSNSPLTSPPQLLKFSGAGEVILALFLFTIFLAFGLRQWPRRRRSDATQFHDGGIATATSAAEPGSERSLTESLQQKADNDLDTTHGMETKPARSDEATKALQEADTAAGSAQFPHAEPVRVLIAEDSQVNMMVLEKMLPAPDFNLSMAEDGQEAVDLFARLREMDALPDIVLLDIEMPLLNGFEVAAKLREIEQEHDLGPRPIIAVTALGDSMHFEASREAGMNDHLVKPVKRDLLMTSIVKTMVHLARRNP